MFTDTFASTTQYLFTRWQIICLAFKWDININVIIRVYKLIKRVLRLFVCGTSNEITRAEFQRPRAQYSGPGKPTCWRFNSVWIF